MRVWGATVDRGSLQLPHGWFFGDSPGGGWGGAFGKFCFGMIIMVLQPMDTNQQHRQLQRKCL